MLVCSSVDFRFLFNRPMNFIPRKLDSMMCRNVVKKFKDVFRVGLGLCATMSLVRLYSHLIFTYVNLFSWCHHGYRKLWEMCERETFTEKESICAIKV
jgi:hypothetical protein